VFFSCREDALVAECACGLSIVVGALLLESLHVGFDDEELGQVRYVSDMEVGVLPCW